MGPGMETSPSFASMRTWREWAVFWGGVSVGLLVGWLWWRVLVGCG